MADERSRLRAKPRANECVHRCYEGPKATRMDETTKLETATLNVFVAKLDP